MRSSILHPGVAVLGTALLGCGQTTLTWIKHETCRPVRSPAEVRMHLTRKAVPHPYRVVARYRVVTSGQPLAVVLRKLRARAARHGCDAVLVERGFGRSVTVWSWLFFFVPVTDHARVLEVAGIRYTPTGGPS